MEAVYYAIARNEALDAAQFLELILGASCQPAGAAPTIEPSPLSVLRSSLVKPVYDKTNEALLSYPLFAERLMGWLVCGDRLLEYEAREVVVAALRLSFRLGSQVLQGRLLDVIVPASAWSLRAVADRCDACLAVCDLLASCTSRQGFSADSSHRVAQLQLVAALLPAFEQQWCRALDSVSPLHAIAISRAFRKLLRLLADPAVVLSPSASSATVQSPETVLGLQQKCCTAVSATLVLIAATFSRAIVARGAGPVETASDSDGCSRVDARVDCARLLSLATAYRLWSPCTTSASNVSRRIASPTLDCSEWFKELSVDLLQAFAYAGLTGLRFPEASSLPAAGSLSSAPLLPPLKVAECDLYSTRRKHLCPTGTELGQRYRLVVVLHAAAAALTTVDPTSADVQLVDQALLRLEQYAERGHFTSTSAFANLTQFLGAHVVDALLTSDDLLVEALLCLLAVHDRLQYWANTQEGRPSESTGRWMMSVDPHRTFAHLIEKTGFNHHVLLDWLISPETKFLLYFVKYLKCLAKSVDGSHPAAPGNISGRTESCTVDVSRDKSTASSGLMFLASSYSVDSSDDEAGDGSASPANHPTGSVRSPRHWVVPVGPPSSGGQAAGHERKAPTAAIGMCGVAKVVGYGEALVLSRLEVALQGMLASGVFPYNASPLLRLLRGLRLPSCLPIT